MRTSAVSITSCFLALLAIAGLGAGGCALFGRSPEERLRLAREGGDSARLREVLLQVQSGPTSAMRSDLEQVLGTEADPTVRAAAADALGKLGSPDSIPQLRAAARQDGHWIVRKRAGRALARILGSDARGDLEFLLRNDPEPRVRAAAVELVAARLPLQDAVPMLVEALRDKADEVRLRAHVALRELTGQSLPPKHEQWKAALQTGQEAP